MTVHIGIGGGQGRMGAALRASIEKTTDMIVTAVTLAPGKAEPLAVDIVSLQKNLVDVWIDFTRPAISLVHLDTCVRLGIPMVIGTTGFSEAEETIIQEASQTIPIVYAANTSIGVTLCMGWLAQAAQVFEEQATIHIEETHHQHKLDAPSGTARTMVNVITGGFKEAVPDIQISSIRTGEVIGQHVVCFKTPEETITISHEALSRDIFVQGALRAARWIILQSPGLYTMQEVLAL